MTGKLDEAERLPVDQIHIEREVTQETPDGTTLNATVFRPTASDDVGVPAILNRSIYGIPEDVVARGWYLDDALVSKALAKGYAVVYQSTRGTGKSGGEFDWAESEVTDGASAIRWIAGQEWCDGRVGMFGGSSRGLAMMLAAAGNPEPLKAINPIASPAGGGDGTIIDGAIQANSFIPWTMKLATLTAGRLLERGELDDATFEAIGEAATTATEQTTELASYRPFFDLPDHVFADVSLPETLAPKDLIPFWEPWLAREGDDPYWEQIDPRYMYDQMDVPALHVTGWFDSMQHGTISNYRGMTEATPSDQYLIVGPYHHMNIGQTMCVGEIEFGPSAGLTGLTFSGFAELQVEFFDIYLKNKEPAANSLFDPAEPSVQTFGMEPDGGRWTTHEAWPPADAEQRTWFLASDGNANENLDDGELRGTAPDGKQPADTYVHDPDDPVPSRGGALSCRSVHYPPGVHDVSDLQERPDVVTYTSPPLDDAVEVAGPGEVTLHYETGGEETDFVARLSHVFDDGRAFNLTDGITRTGWGGSESLAAEIQLWDTQYRIPAGDRLRLEIMSSHAPRFDPHPNTSQPWHASPDDVRPAEQTIHHDHDLPSALTVWTM